jgi:hypothetical protein
LNNKTIMPESSDGVPDAKEGNGNLNNSAEGRH